MEDAIKRVFKGGCCVESFTHWLSSGGALGAVQAWRVAHGELRPPCMHTLAGFFIKRHTSPMAFLAKSFQERRQKRKKSAKLKKKNETDNAFHELFHAEMVGELFGCEEGEEEAFWTNVCGEEQSGADSCDHLFEHGGA